MLTCPAIILFLSEPCPHPYWSVAQDPPLLKTCWSFSKPFLKVCRLFTAAFVSENAQAFSSDSRWGLQRMVMLLPPAMLLLHAFALQHAMLSFWHCPSFVTQKQSLLCHCPCVLSLCACHVLLALWPEHIALTVCCTCLECCNMSIVPANSVFGIACSPP